MKMNPWMAVVLIPHLTIPSAGPKEGIRRATDLLKITAFNQHSNS
jgi:hypothetical protein